MRRAGQHLARVFGTGQFHGVIRLPQTDPCCHGNDVCMPKVSAANIAEFPNLVDCVLESRDA